MTPLPLGVTFAKEGDAIAYLAAILLGFAAGVAGGSLYLSKAPDSLKVAGLIVIGLGVCGGLGADVVVTYLGGTVGDTYNLASISYALFQAPLGLITIAGGLLGAGLVERVNGREGGSQ